MPAGISREVVVCEEVIVDAALPIVLANGTGQRLNRPETHLVSLHVNDSAEAAVVWAAPATINRAEVRGYEALQI